ncbi:MAG: hypothetical protein A2504_06870 [Bdellovibrionales bacterium RIFOXYD12_FULL_39_22]|nr:MAG: hypothetical protein A2385_09190 [Bdellovibrionales bacterium RIFOXYB1_FULL_39_21]OFZ45128.1 MAG: hypothetical protein A2485_05350 [Bdellovibrionales bacterium RIFOXYC12_FULL_39_17]OFZ45680.1 MAG: hypothetical protein A2404_03770 [Bdellovibrionales bacterium RIFOXYC1_FULL_39_130]OFZ72651.1 MAG: hypothetical protein A2451_14270 [Bdellovibrionales bacterium RIFOXYC2_FULL_39_8]OFZ77542.1 MAG: hypothetical protein A2560_09355 [Bdellovibrionales bacterium RIFOXYD1_FULL_39_84]OFZ91671.1 MAG:
MGISFGSIGTGLPKDIVQQLLTAEKAPLEQMEAKKGKIETKKKLVEEAIGLVEKIRGNLTANSSVKNLRELKYETRNDIIDVALDKNIAEPGEHQIEVIQLAQKSTAMSSGFKDKDNSYVGVGYIQYTLPNGDNREIYIDSEHASIAGIAKLINNDPESGMTAQVVNDGSGTDTPWRLLISLSETGAGNKAEFPYFYFIDGEDDLYLESQRPAQNAKIKLNGFEIELPSNKNSDLIPGVTLNLKKAMPGEEFSLKISEDVGAITEKVDDLVAKINGVLSFIKAQNTMDAKTDTSITLGGDMSLQSLESRIRRAVFQDVQTTFGPRRFGDLGVQFSREGVLQLDKKKFESVLASDFRAATQILRGIYTEEGVKSYGFMDYLEEAVENCLRAPDGLLLSRKNTFQSNINEMDRRIQDKMRSIAQKEENLKMKFARLESTIANLQKSSAGIASLAANNVSPVTQLG